MKANGLAAIVTGGASGLGEATARKLAENGAKVSIFDLNEDLGNTVAKEIGGLFVACDVTNEDSVKAAMSAASEAHGTARLLVNCAGIGNAARTVGREGPHDLGLFSKIISVNLIGSFNVSRVFSWEASKLDPLDDNDRGVIVMTASVAAFDGQIGQVAYAASKGGIHSMTLPMARDLSNVGIRVCTIAPGVLKTPLMDILPEKAQEALAQSIPFPRRLGHADEFASLAMSIIENGYLNGETIRLDGALRLPPR